MSIKNIVIEDVHGFISIEFPIKHFQYANYGWLLLD